MGDASSRRWWRPMRGWLTRWLSLVLAILLVGTYGMGAASAYSTTPNYTYKYNFQVTSYQDVAAKVSWMIPSGQSVASIRIEGSTDGGNYWYSNVNTGGTISTTATSALIMDLTPNTTYMFRLVVSGSGTSYTDYANPVTVTTEKTIQVANPIPSQNFVFGGPMSATFDISNLFNNPNGGALTYSAYSQNSYLASVTLSGTKLTITGVSEGDVTVSLLAVDAHNQQAGTTIGVSVKAGMVGHVTDMVTGAPVAGVNLKVVATDSTALREFGTTNANGDYCIPVTSGHSYQVSATSNTGYLPYTSTTTYAVAKNSFAAADFALDPADREIMSISIPSQLSTATIDSANANVDITVDSSEGVTALVPTIAVSSGATVSPASGVVRDFSSPVSYTVTSQTGRQKIWTVTVHAKPASPTVNPIGDSDTVITGTAEAGTTVQAYTGSTLIGTVDPTAAHAPFSMSIAKLAVNTQVTVKATDSMGRVSDSTVVYVRDTTPPNAPSVNSVYDTDTVVKGKTETSAVVKVKSADGSQVIGTATALSDGTFSVTIPKQIGGATLLVTATDTAGHESQPATVHVIDTLPPAPPSPNTVTDQDMQTTGTAEPNSTITVTNYNTSAVLGTGRTASDGKFAVAIPLQKAGTYLKIVATDAVGHASAGALIAVKDGAPPVAPTVNPVTDHDTVVTGVAEPNDSITVMNSSYVKWTGTANASGAFSVSIPVQVAGSVLYVTAADGGGTSPYVQVLIRDATPPAAPTVNSVGDSDKWVSGHAEPGAAVTVREQSTRTVLGTGMAIYNGNYNVAIAKQQAGTVLNVTATDASGNVSPAATVTVADTTPPAKPSVHEVLITDTQVTGTTEAGASVNVAVNGTVIGTGTAADDNTFSVPIAPQAEGTVLSVTATDAAGNVSAPTTVNVYVPDTTPPAAPQVHPVSDQDTILTGTTEAGASVTVMVQGVVLSAGTAGTTGDFSLPILKQTAGTQLVVTATDAAGNVSQSASVTVADKTPPSKPMVIDVSDQDMQVTGTAEAGATVSVLTEGTVLGQGVADADGKFSIAISSLQAGGTILSVTAKDAAGNVSDTATVTVTATSAPVPKTVAAPVVNPITDQDKTITGTVEPGLAVTVQKEIINWNGFPTTQTICTEYALADGTFTLPLLQPEAAGTQLEFLAQDADGNQSPLTFVTVTAAPPVPDTTAPAKPDVFDVTDHDTEVIGNAEANSTITVSANGQVVGTGVTGVTGGFGINIPTQPGGTVLSVTATDAAGNVSEAATITVTALPVPVSKPIAAPVVNPITDQDKTITGTAEPGLAVTVQKEIINWNGFPTTQTICTEYALADGTFTLPLLQPEAAGTQLEFLAQDADGNQSPLTFVTVTAAPPVADTTPPSAPIVQDIGDNETAVTGTAEPNSLIQVMAGTTLLGSGDANSAGEFTVTIPQQMAGTTLSVTATDAAGNVSEATIKTVLDNTSPNTPTVNAVQNTDTTINGTAEPHATIQVFLGSQLLGSGAVKDDGTFSIAIPPVAIGSALSVIAIDAGGHKSQDTRVTVKLLSPHVGALKEKETRIQGTAYALSSITVKNGDKVIGSTKADKTGHFSISIRALAKGTVLTATANLNGNTSDSILFTVLDGTAPTAPQVNPVKDSDIQITGTTEAGATVTVAGADNKSIASTTANDQGVFQITLAAHPKMGTTFYVTSTDATGNVSLKTTVKVLDGTPPPAPVVPKVTDVDRVVQGTAEASAALTITIDGKTLATGKADSKGNFSISIRPQALGTILKLTASDAAHNVSVETSVTVQDGTPPLAPLVNTVKDNETVVTGTTEAGASLTITAGTTVIGTGSANADGTFAVKLTNAQPVNTRLSVTAADAMKNVSTATVVTVKDGTPPKAPIVNGVSDTDRVVKGTAEAYATITISVNGTELATGTANYKGTYSITITKQTAGTVLKVTASDASKNVSEATTVTVSVHDSTPPAAPQVLPVTNADTKVSGTAEAGATVYVKVGTRELGHIVADSNGAFEVALSQKVSTGTALKITAIDASGNVSASTTIVVVANK